MLLPVDYRVYLVLLKREEENKKREEENKKGEGRRQEERYKVHRIHHLRKCRLPGTSVATTCVRFACKYHCL